MQALLNQLLTTQIFTLALVFCRIGAALSLVPGIGDSMVPARFRLGIAFSLTIILAPILSPVIPNIPQTTGELFFLMGSEVTIGLFIGLVMRIIMTSLDIAGTFISMINGLSSASILNPLLQQQSSVISVFLMTIGGVLIFATGLHELMLRAIYDSYEVFVPGKLPPMGDLTKVVVEMTSRAFRIGLQLSFPTLVIITLLLIVLGVMARLVPQLQVFFVALPLQIIVGLIILIVGLGSLFYVFSGQFSEALSLLLNPN